VPAVIAGLTTSLAELIGVAGYRDEAVTLLAVGFEMCLPMATGMLVASFCSRDEVVELQLTMPGAYAQTARYRLALLAGWPALFALAAGALLYRQGIWPRPAQVAAWATLPQAVVAPLVWLAPLFWCVAVGLLLALVLRSRAASAAVLGGIWVAQIAFYRSIAATLALQPVFLFATTFTPDADDWLTTRLELVATALVVLPLAWRLLGRKEAVLHLAGDEE